MATIVDGEKIIVRREVSDIVEISVDQSAQTEIVIEQDGKLLDPIVINKGDTNKINISQ